MRWLAVLFLSSMIYAQAPRVMEHQVEVNALEKVELAVNVGDIRIDVVEGSSIHIKVTLTAHKRGIFGNAKKLESTMKEARLLSRVNDRRILKLEIDAPYKKKYLQEDWVIQVPSHLGFELDNGVGDINLDGIRGQIDINSGVGTITLTRVSGSIEVDVGVGDVNIQAQGSSYKNIELDTGTGDASLHNLQGIIQDDDFLGGHLLWKGTGSHRIEVDTGVGDIIVRID